MPTKSRAEIIIVHSSDLHLGTDDSFSNSDRLETLPKVLSTAAEVNADVVLLAGDSFDNHRQPERLLERAAQIHGDYVDEIRDPNRLIGSWLIHREELDATDAEYVALGHWNQATKVGDENKHAYYSGSPDYSGTVKLVRFPNN